MLAEGMTAPEFTLQDQNGHPVSLSDFRGRWLALWWFPKAFTSGWTKEGRGFRDRAPEFEKEGLEIVGISFDTPEDNRGFAEQNGFPFRLLSDVDRGVGASYQTLRAPEESSPEFAKRRTYLIDPDGVIRKAYRVTDIPAHPDQVLEDFRALAGKERS